MWFYMTLYQTQKPLSDILASLNKHTKLRWSRVSNHTIHKSKYAYALLQKVHFYDAIHIFIQIHWNHIRMAQNSPRVHYFNKVRS